jgi:hypothetical protein
LYPTIAKANELVIISVCIIFIKKAFPAKVKTADFRRETNMGKCKVIPFQKPQVSHKKSFWARILQKIRLIGNKNGRHSNVVVRDFDPKALPASKRDRKA